MYSPPPGLISRCGSSLGSSGEMCRPCVWRLVLFGWRFSLTSKSSPFATSCNRLTSRTRTVSPALARIVGPGKPPLNRRERTRTALGKCSVPTPSRKSQSRDEQAAGCANAAFAVPASLPVVPPGTNSPDARRRRPRMVTAASMTARPLRK